MGSILIAMPRIEDANHLCELLNSHSRQYPDVEICQTASEILRISNERDYGVVICTKTLKDMSSMELSEYLPVFFGMIILTKDMALETYSDRIVKLLMPFKTSELLSTIEMMTEVFVRRIKKKRNGPLKRSAAQDKIVLEAKRLLMERNGMNEPEAFRYIQKCSMDTGRNMVESAQMILMLNN